MGSIFLTSLTGFAKEVLGGDELVVLLLMGLFTIGIGIGCVLCEKMSGHKIEIGLVLMAWMAMRLGREVAEEEKI